MRSEHIGSNFDNFLAEDGSLEEATATAVKRVIAWQLAQAMKAQRISKTEMAARMHSCATQLPLSLPWCCPHRGDRVGAESG